MSNLPPYITLCMDCGSKIASRTWVSDAVKAYLHACRHADLRQKLSTEGTESVLATLPVQQSETSLTVIGDLVQYRDDDGELVVDVDVN